MFGVYILFEEPGPADSFLTNKIPEVELRNKEDALAGSAVYAFVSGEMKHRIF